MEKEEQNLEKILKDAGFSNLVEKFKNQDIVTLDAAIGLTIEDLTNYVGCKPVAAKMIYNKLQQSGIPSGTDQNNQIVPFQHQMQMMQLQMSLESAQKLAALEAKIQEQEMEAKHKQEMTDLKHKADIDSLNKDLEHQKQLQKLQTEKNAAIFKGKLAVMEEKNKYKPLETPSWWSATYGIWDPLLFERYPAVSVLLTPHFFRIIQGWLGGTRLWDLRYRGTRDGFTSNDFHRCCDNIGATVTLIRANGYLFGGYTPLSWNTSSKYLNNSSSFLFTLTNSHGASPTHFSCTKSQHSTFCYSSYGPTFGGGHDLHISSNSNANTTSYSNFPDSYNDSIGYAKTTFAGAYNFTVSEIEVFRVI